MNISVFLSYSSPYNQKQEDFIKEIQEYLKERGLYPRTVGVTDYDPNEPLTAIRRLMMESNGLITVAFRRTHIVTGVKYHSKEKKQEGSDILNQWLTSPFCHIEPAMAFQIGLPILVLREKGVIDDGILERGIAGTYLPEFNLENSSINYLESNEWKQIIGKWESYVHRVAENKGCPPKLY